MLISSKFLGYVYQVHFIIHLSNGIARQIRTKTANRIIRFRSVMNQHYKKLPSKSCACTRTFARTVAESLDDCAAEILTATVR